MRATTGSVVYDDQCEGNEGCNCCCSCCCLPAFAVSCTHPCGALAYACYYCLLDATASHTCPICLSAQHQAALFTCDCQDPDGSPSRPENSSSVSGARDKYRGPSPGDTEADYVQQKQSMRRMHAVNELLQTERDYVNDLCYLAEVWFLVLARQDWISKEHLQIIVRNASELLEFHRQFLAMLEACDDHYIGHVFLDMSSYFMLYTHYCDLHTDAWALCEFYREKSEWVSFLKECAAVGAEGTPAASSVLTGSLVDPSASVGSQKRLQFEDYLIKPIQRICRYPLLIKEIRRYTPDDIAEQTGLDEALSMMQDTVAEIDRLKHERDNIERTRRIIQRIDGDWRIEKQHLSHLGCVLVAGALEVAYTALGHSVGKPRYLGCFLFPTYIILVRPKKVAVYEPKHWFPLKFADFEDLPDTEGQRENAFVVRCKKHTFAFSATCAQEKQLWVKHIKEAIENAKSTTSKPCDDFIVPSLSGVGTPAQKTVTVSRSFTNLLDMKIMGNSNNNPATCSKLKRSMSTSVQLGDRPLRRCDSVLLSPPSPSPLKKRYSVDYPPATRTKERVKTRNNSETYLKTSVSEIQRRKRPSSLDLLATANSPANVIGKMSHQIRSNHQNALRMAIDHKLLDVCTPEFLSSRAWYLRDRELTASGVDLRKRKSGPFMRSASTLSLMSPKRASGTYTPRQLNDYEIQSVVSSVSSADDSGLSRLNPSREASRRTSQTKHSNSQRRASPATPTLPPTEDGEAVENSSMPQHSFTDMSPSEQYHEQQGTEPLGRLERTFSGYSFNLRKSAIVGKVVDKFSAVRKKPQFYDTTSQSFIHEEYHSDVNSCNASETGLSHAGTTSNTSLQMWQMRQTSSNMTSSQHDYEHKSKGPLFRWGRNEPNRVTRKEWPATDKPFAARPPSAFAYASTPAEPPPSRWKKRLSILRQPTFGKHNQLSEISQ